MVTVRRELKRILERPCSRESRKPDWKNRVITEIIRNISVRIWMFIIKHFYFSFDRGNIKIEILFRVHFDKVEDFAVVATAFCIK